MECFFPFSLHLLVSYSFISCSTWLASKILGDALMGVFANVLFVRSLLMFLFSAMVDVKGYDFVEKSAFDM